MKWKIAIVDDHPVLRQGLRMFVESDESFEVCSETDNINDAIKVLNTRNPDVIIVDLSFGDELTGLELIKAVSVRFPAVKILVLTMLDENIYAERCIRAGAWGYIMKNEAREKILMAIKKILDGKIYLSESVSDIILNKLIGKKAQGNYGSLSFLSNREFEVFQHIGNGLSSREIARKMNLSRNTVDSHKRKIKEKLKIKNSSELIKQAVLWTLSKKI